jgi:hypothetical protein
MGQGYTMAMKQEPFTRYHEEKAIDAFTVRLNAAERAALEADKKILNQPKDSTALKQLARIGSKVIHDDLIGSVVKEVTDNKRRNERLGINDFE